MDNDQTTHTEVQRSGHSQHQRTRIPTITPWMSPYLRDSYSAHQSTKNLSGDTSGLIPLHDHCCDRHWSNPGKFRIIVNIIGRLFKLLRDNYKKCVTFLHTGQVYSTSMIEISLKYTLLYSY